MSIDNVKRGAPQYKIKEGEDPFGHLPAEIILIIFSHLSAKELARSCLVSRHWCKLASSPSLWNAIDLKKVFPLLRIFDEFDWATHIDLSSLELSIEDTPPLDKRKEIPVLKGVLSSLSVDGNAGITLLTIPKGLTLNKLVKLARSPKLGNATKFRNFWASISSALGDIPVDKTYRVVITNYILPESRNLSFDAQKNLVRSFGFEMPKVLEATTLLVITYMCSAWRLYTDNPWTYTRCSEQVDDRQLIVGGFGLDGLEVNYSIYDFRGCGVAVALRQF